MYIEQKSSKWDCNFCTIMLFSLVEIADYDVKKSTSSKNQVDEIVIFVLFCFFPEMKWLIMVCPCVPISICFICSKKQRFLNLSHLLNAPKVYKHYIYIYMYVCIYRMCSQLCCNWNILYIFLFLTLFLFTPLKVMTRCTRFVKGIMIDKGKFILAFWIILFKAVLQNYLIMWVCVCVCCVYWNCQYILTNPPCAYLRQTI